MTDFYTVLRNALDRVGAVESDERDRVYGHVRDVMVRKLRNHRPPVAEAEIESRISTFDAAIDRIEAEFAEQRESPGRQPMREPALQQAAEKERQPEPGPARLGAERAPARTRRRDADRRAEPVAVPARQVVPAEEGASEWDDAAPSPEPMWGAPAIDMAWDETSAQWHDARRNGSEPAADEALEIVPEDDRPAKRRRGLGRRRKDRQALPNGLDTADWPEARDRRANGEDAAEGRSGGLLRRFRSSVKRRKANGADDGLSEPVLDKPPSRPNGDVRRERRRDGHDPIAELANRLDARGVAPARAEPLLLGPPAARAESGLYLPSPEQVAVVAEDAPRRRGRRNAEPAADEDIAGEEPPRRRGRRKAAERRIPEEDLADEKAAADAPQRRHGRLAVILLVLFGVTVIVWSGYVLLQLLSSSGSGGTTTAEEPGPAVAETPAGAAEAIILFQGTDPTVFEAGADNPVHYQGDTAGGFVRIGSSISSGGARAVIGPGIANRLAGHQVRVIIEARGSPGQAAAAVWFGYQRGLAVLERRIQPLLGDFAVLTPTWVIPDGPAGGNDYLIIEPGVPGDGTAIDIRSIRIEILD